MAVFKHGERKINETNEDVIWNYHHTTKEDAKEEEDVKYEFLLHGELKIPAWGPCLVKTRVEQELVDLLLEKGKECRKKNLDYRYKLAGQIENEYYFEEVESWFVPKFSPYLDAYIKRANDHLGNAFGGKTQPLKINLTSLWINYQQALEYNPPHNHDGDVSFVICLQVPDEIKKENKEMQGVHNNLGPGVIHFDFPGIQLPFCGTTFSQLPEAGDIFMFPSWLTHHVSSFKSDVERITVSGNINFENSDRNNQFEKPIPKDKRVDLIYQPFDRLST